MILAEIGKFVGAKVATALVFLAVAAGAYWCYQHPEALKASARVVERTAIWMVVAAALPWSSYLYMRPLLAMQSGASSVQGAAAMGVLVIAGYSLIDAVLAMWLAGWSGHGGFTWLVMFLGFAAAAAYNFVICESLARQAGS